jgi:thiol-disulfide isomerase/thioredoxin
MGIMKRLVIMLILTIALVIQGHTRGDSTLQNGVHFEKGLNWLQILAKAKAKNKYIFVDCYATWCEPCKEMDHDVYTNDSLGEWMSRQFVSVKVQLDSTNHDNPEVQKWYPVAHQLERDYQIKAYPSFLFFSPDGRPMDKKVGGRDVKAFMEIARAAMDPAQQFYTLLSQYQNGGKSYPQVPKLAGMARSIGEDSLAKALATDYLHNYLLKLPPDQRWMPDNIRFLNDYGNTVSIKDKLFKLYFKDRKTINQVMNDTAYADGLINRVVYKDMVKLEVQQGVKTNLEPDWAALEKNIRKHYGSVYVDRNIVPGKVDYYRSTKRWTQYTKYLVIRLKQNKIETWPAGTMTSLVMNNNAFEVFKYSKDKEDLETALAWVDKALSMQAGLDASELDTKANILYKLGRKKEAIALESKAAEIDPKAQDILETLQKMRNGEPTWPLHAGR